MGGWGDGEIEKYLVMVALLHESSVLNIHSAVISPCDCNCYYWTIVMALLLSAIRSKCDSLIALRLQLLL
ncbi:MAG: hypothetical protein SWX82_28095, partial [Cyanobacteriota bacterium]|nr:hypothetical protein [Cyanobacteriota bacterium]